MLTGAIKGAVIVHLVPGQSLQHLQLRALNVKAEIVHPAKK
jgi:hypothetical protein